MDELILYLKEIFEFEVVRRDKTSIVIRWEKINADKFQTITQKVLDKLSTTSTIKIYKLGTEQQYQVYRIFFVLDIDLDSEKLVELYKTELSVEDNQQESILDSLRISYSQLSDFLACHHKHYLGYTKKLKTYDSDTIHLIFGTHMHTTIEKFLKKELTREKALIYFSSCMLSPETRAKQPVKLIVRFRKQGIAILNEFFTKFAWDEIIIIENELELNEPIFNNFYFTGKVDFIYRYKNFIYIADFKTSTKEWDKWKFDNEYYGLQLKLYKWFYCQKMKIPYDNIRLAYVVLNRNDIEAPIKSLINIYEVPSTYGEIRKSYNILVDALKTIYSVELSGDYLRRTTGYNCNICEFNGGGHCEGNIGTKFYRDIKASILAPKEKTNEDK